MKDFVWPVSIPPYSDSHQWCKIRHLNYPCLMKSWEAGKKTKALAVPLCTIQDESHPMWDPTSHLVWDILDTSKSEIVILISLRKWKDGNYLLQALSLVWKELRHRLQGIYWISLYWPTIQGPKVQSPACRFLHGEIHSRHSQTPKSTCCCILPFTRQEKHQVANVTKMGRIPPWQYQNTTMHPWGSCLPQREIEGSTKPFNE